MPQCTLTQHNNKKKRGKKVLNKLKKMKGAGVSQFPSIIHPNDLKNS
jgi:hypothetical protein